MNTISQLQSLIAKSYSNTVGIIALKDGKTVIEQYFNGQKAETKNHVFSVTKSIVSMLLGIAIDKRLIKNENQKVLDFFPDFLAPQNNKAIHDITIRDMLTMTAPYRYIFPNYPKYFTQNDWVRASLEQLGGKKPIVRVTESEVSATQKVSDTQKVSTAQKASSTQKTGFAPKVGSSRCPFRYAGLIGPDILSGILVKATGKSVLEFANENLFTPLGINVEKSIIFASKEDQMNFYKTIDNNGWVAAENGIHTAGWGLNLTAQDLAKLGQLYLSGGLYNGKQIISADWVNKSTTFQSYCKQFKLSYGYWWWLLDDDSFAAMGDGGNVLYVNRAKNIVIALTAVMVPHAKLRIDLIKNVIEPMCDSSF